MDGDVLYAEFYDRIINQPEESVYQTVSDGMNLLKNESAVIQISEGSLKVQFKISMSINDRYLCLSCESSVFCLSSHP